MKINIDAPCHENWDAMTPNDKGAFCLSCQKTVIDFSTQSIGEIKSFFKELHLTEKVCGRFANNQLEAMTFDHFFKRFKRWNLLHKIAVVCFFTFGLALFSCTPGGSHEVMGEADIHRGDTIQAQSMVTPADTPMIMGQPIAPIDTTKKQPVKKSPAHVAKPVGMLQGDVVVEPDPVIMTKGEISLYPDKEPVKCTTIDTRKKEDDLIKGKIKLNP